MEEPNKARKKKRKTFTLGRDYQPLQEEKVLIDGELYHLGYTSPPEALRGDSTKSPDKDSEEKRKAVSAYFDLLRLGRNKKFQGAVLGLKGDETRVMDLCDRFLIGDVGWMRHVIKHWDGKSLLPRTDDPKIHNSLIEVGPWESNFLATNKGYRGGGYEYFKGSPRLRCQSMYQQDDSGEEWLTVRIRLTEDLTETQVHSWIHSNIFKSKNHKKPSTGGVVFTMLNRGPVELKSKSIYALGQYIEKEVNLELKSLRINAVKKSHARKLAREWLNSKK